MLPGSFYSSAHKPIHRMSHQCHLGFRRSRQPETITYQWTLTTSTATNAITDATNASLTLPAVSASDVRQLHGCRHYLLFGSSTSSPAVITLVDTTAPVVTVTGGDLTIECHGGYADQGATASDTCAGTVAASLTGGSVNANATGVYTLTYSATDGSNTGTAIRLVTVGDTTAPVITVTGGDQLIVNVMAVIPTRAQRPMMSVLERKLRLSRAAVSMPIFPAFIL